MDSINDLENYLCQFITWLEKEDGSNYKVESVHNCYSALNRYLKEHSVLQPIKIWDRYKFPHALHTLDGKMRILQDEGLGDPKKSDGLSAKEIKQILDHPYMDINSNESLTRQVFFWLCLLCRLRGEDAYRICRKDLNYCQDGGLELVLHKEKNNQGGAFYKNKHGKSGSRHIPIPPDSPGNQYTPIKDILLFLSKLPHSTSSQDALFHETCRKKKDLKKGNWFKNKPMGYSKLRKIMNDIATNTGINLDNRRLITNHSCRRTAIQMLKDNGLSDSDLQSFSGHQSRESLADYCKTSDNQQVLNTAMLIPFTLHENNLDEHNDEHINYDEDYSENSSNEDMENEKCLSESQETELPIIKKTQDIQKTPLREIQVSPFQETPVQKIRFPQFKKLQIKFLQFKKVRSSSQISKSHKPVTTPFKPPCHSDSPMIAYYRKKESLSTVNKANKTNIVIKLPPGTSSQSYSLNINLKLDS
ncbi:unnamed protein product [Rhizophagus irregularis]|nr:unnamed protein product [Rhizophagus irregularis]CAB5385945.1 unnamed protein product [Rhizophagus irregularis]